MKKLKTTTQIHEQLVENYENLGKVQIFKLDYYSAFIYLVI